MSGVSKKRVIVSVTSDLTGDQRVERICRTLVSMGFSLLLAGRRLPGSADLPGLPYATRRFRLLFRKGPLFYAEFNLRLSLFLLLRKSDLLLANDLDTLLANRIAGWCKQIPVIYDSHELFTEVPELMGRPRVKRIWEWLEKRLVPGVAAAFTVSPPIADFYTARYQIPFSVVRNLPMEDQESPTLSPPETASGEMVPEGESRQPENAPSIADQNRREELAEPFKGDVRPYLIYQGALNMGRGLESLIKAMALLPEADLVIAGGGDLERELKELARSLNCRNVKFTGRLTPSQLRPLTRRAAGGISIEEETGLSYRYALPNKLFDYIQAQIPVVVSDLPEMKKVVTQYDIGMISRSHDAKPLAELLTQFLTNSTLRKKWMQNLQNAAGELTWRHEEKIVMDIFNPFL